MIIVLVNLHLHRNIWIPRIRSACGPDNAMLLTIDERLNDHHLVVRQTPEKPDLEILVMDSLGNAHAVAKDVVGLVINLSDGCLDDLREHLTPATEMERVTAMFAHASDEEEPTFTEEIRPLLSPNGPDIIVYTHQEEKRRPTDENWRHIQETLGLEMEPTPAEILHGLKSVFSTPETVFNQCMNDKWEDLQSSWERIYGVDAKTINDWRRRARREIDSLSTDHQLFTKRGDITPIVDGARQLADRIERFFNPATTTDDRPDGDEISNLRNELRSWNDWICQVSGAEDDRTA